MKLLLPNLCFFVANRKTKMAAPTSDWPRHFRLLLWNCWTEFDNFSTSSTKFVFFGPIGKDKMAALSDPSTKVANCTPVHDMWPFRLLVCAKFILFNFYVKKDITRLLMILLDCARFKAFGPRLLFGTIPQIWRHPFQLAKKSPLVVHNADDMAVTGHSSYLKTNYGMVQKVLSPGIHTWSMKAPSCIVLKICTRLEILSTDDAGDKMIALQTFVGWLY